MSKYNVIKLTQLSPWHVGIGKDSYDFSSSVLHSDTLTSALAALRAQGGQTDNLMSFLSSFAMSSAFPFYCDRLFLPRASGRLEVTIDGADGDIMRKQLKKVQFVESDLWIRLFTGGVKDIHSNQLQGAFLSSEKHGPLPKIQTSATHERVAVPRFDAGNSEPFYFEWTFFRPDSGLYVLTDASGVLLDEIMTLMEQLGEQGVGTDRNVGGGKFVPVLSGQIELPDVPDSKSRMLLSLYLPTEKELAGIELKHSRYNLILRGGFMAGSAETRFRHLRKKSVYMFDEGSVLYSANLLEGMVTDLKPDWNDDAMHSVYRSGRVISVAISDN